MIMENQDKPNNTNENTLDTSHCEECARNPNLDEYNPNGGEASSGISRTNKALAAGITGTAAAVYLTPIALTTLGFGTAGIAAGSAAAKMMSSAATSGCGMGVVSTFQAAGAAGLGPAATVLCVIGGAATGGGIAAAIDRNVANIKEPNTSQSFGASVSSVVSNIFGNTVHIGMDVASSLRSAGASGYGLAAQAWKRGYETAVVGGRRDAAAGKEQETSLVSYASDGVRPKETEDTVGERMAAPGDGRSNTHEVSYTHGNTGINRVGVVSAVQSAAQASKEWTSAGVAAVGGGIRAALNRKAETKKENDVGQGENATENKYSEHISSYQSQKAAYEKSKL